MKVFYICDKKNKCSWSPICGKKDGCNHISDPKHALNGPCKDTKTDKRFTKTPFGDYVEDMPNWSETPKK